MRSGACATVAVTVGCVLFWIFLFVAAWSFSALNNHESYNSELVEANCSITQLGLRAAEYGSCNRNRQNVLHVWDTQKEHVAKTDSDEWDEKITYWENVDCQVADMTVILDNGQAYHVPQDTLRFRNHVWNCDLCEPDRDETNQLDIVRIDNCADVHGTKIQSCNQHYNELFTYSQSTNGMFRCTYPADKATGLPSMKCCITPGNKEALLKNTAKVLQRAVIFLVLAIVAFLLVCGGCVCCNVYNPGDGKQDHLSPMWSGDRNTLEEDDPRIPAAWKTLIPEAVE